MMEIHRRASISYQQSVHASIERLCYCDVSYVSDLELEVELGNDEVALSFLLFSSSESDRQIAFHPLPCKKGKKQGVGGGKQTHG